MARLSNPLETETNLRLSGKDSLVSWAKRGLELLRYSDQRCLLVIGVTGDPATTSLARRQALAIARTHGGLFTGTMIGKLWRKSRFLTPYLRNTLWERGYAVDTLETAVPWSKVEITVQEIIQAMDGALEPVNERVLAFAHLSHVYSDGASIYVTYLFRLSSDPNETLERWGRLKSAASRVILAQGGTISHQHGVGLDHAPYLEAEKGSLGVGLLRTAAHFLDPQGLMNPGKLFP
jgi:alkyldihydroxyacetonephosphate synthase